MSKVYVLESTVYTDDGFIMENICAGSEKQLEEYCSKNNLNLAYQQEDEDYNNDWCIDHVCIRSIKKL